MKASLPLLPQGLLIACLIPVTLRAADIDNDGLDDLWQQRFSIASFTGSADPDGDGRINLAESRNFSNPNKPDTNPLGIVMIRDLNPVDGLHDPWQTQFGITAAQKWEDPDGDGRTNLEESMSKSHPFVADAPFSLVGVLTPAVERPGPDSFIARVPDSAQGRRYILEVSDTLLPGSWVTATMINNGSPHQWGTGEELSGEALTGNAPRKFFRWKIDDPDTDGDSLPDWMEMQLGSNPAEYDSDNDGLPDSSEYGSGSDLNNAASFPGDTRPEAMGKKPSVFWVGQSKSVVNSWRKDVVDGETDEGGSIGWTAADGSWGATTYDAGEARWSAKLGDLGWLEDSNAWNIVFPEARASYFSSSYSDETGHGEFHSVQVGRKLVALGTGLQTRKYLPFAVNVMSVNYSYPYGVNELRYYQGVSIDSHQFGALSNRSSTSLSLGPNPADGEVRVESVGLLKLTCVSKPRALDSESYGAGGDPDPWITIPAGASSPLEVIVSGPPTIDVVYRAQGGGLDGTVQDTGVLRLQSSSTSNSTGTVWAGFRGGDGSILYAPQPILNVAVWKRMDLNINIIPLAYGNGVVTDDPRHLPDAATVEQYLNDIYRDQANIACHVTIQPVYYTDWDAHGWDVIDTNWWGGSEIRTVSANDGCMTILDSSVDTHLATNEEFIATLNAPVSLAPGTINVFWVRAPNGIHQFSYNTTEAAEARDPKQLEGASVYGYAFVHNRRNGIAQCWVADFAPRVDENAVNESPAPPGVSALFVLAHEVGHMLGLPHSNNAFIGSLPPHDFETRLMTGLHGPKRSTTPWQLTALERSGIRNGRALLD